MPKFIKRRKIKEINYVIREEWKVFVIYREINDSISKPPKIGEFKTLEEAEHFLNQLQ